jgi:hypothetical protein
MQNMVYARGSLFVSYGAKAPAVKEIAALRPWSEPTVNSSLPRANWSLCLHTFATGEINPGVPAALWYVPFPSDAAQALTDLFPADIKTSEALYKKVEWYLKLPFVSDLSPDTIAAYFRDLPKVMGDLRAEIRKDFAADSSLVHRLPEAYHQAMQQLR